MSARSLPSQASGGATKGDDDDAGKEDAEVKRLLHGVVGRKIVMAESPRDRCPQIADDFTWADRQQPAPEAASDEPQRHIDEAVADQQPHSGEVPEQRAGQPPAQRNAAGKCEVEQR